MDSTLADVIVTIHFAWIFYVVIGQLLILLGIAFGWRWIRSFWFRFTHLTMMLLVAVESLFWLDCPLTVWERDLRGFGADDKLVYSETDSFIARWLGRLVFCQTSDGQVLDGGAWPFLAGYLGFAALVVWSFWKAPPRLPMSTASFIALVHATIGVVLVGSIMKYHFGVGLCFLVQAALWYGLQEKRT